ncbi:hypothetical protein [Allomuricauda sp. CP2A]|jgi:hypothetical protein|uniref:hypothetical protein n=1 Tax=Allomuricauda sp. CP2A TaxID=1848189 RepID=UPI000833F6D5|nr:hypothetical protein [Muricauda sp. CP2A]
MKKQFFQRLAATSFLIFLFLFSCEKEEPLPLDTDQDASADEGPYTLNSVDMEGIPKITDFLSSRAGKDIFKATATGKDDGAVINEEVIRVNDSLGHSNYSFHFTLPDSAENEFYNLVVGESEDGQPQEPTVFHYVCDPEYYEAFEQSGFDPIAFVGTISMYPFDQIFRDGSLSKDTCAEHDQYGDPIPCIRTNVTNGSSSSGAGGSMGGAQSSGGLPSPTTSSYSISVTVYHVVPDGRTFTYGSGSRCEHPGECQIIYEVSTKANNKATDRGCDKCPSAPGGVAANMASRTKLLVDGLRTKLVLSTNEINFLLNNRGLTEDIAAYLRQHTGSTAKEFASWVVDFSMLPDNPCGVGHDCVESIIVIADGLRKFHGEDGLLMAQYLESLISDFDSFTKNDLQAFYDTAKAIMEDYNNRMFDSIAGGFVAGVTPILEIALFEVGAPVAIKLLQKIPVSWVYRGTRLNEMVKKVGLLGKMGYNNTIREVATNTPVAKASELFKTLTKHAISKTNKTDGVILADMGGGNFITYRPITASSSNIPATISLDFRAAGIWSNVRDVKFVLQ